MRVFEKLSQEANRDEIHATIMTINLVVTVIYFITLKTRKKLFDIKWVVLGSDYSLLEPFPTYPVGHQLSWELAC